MYLKSTKTTNYKPEMKMLHTWYDGMPVQGTRRGIKFSGVIIDSRWTVDGRGTIFTVQLDKEFDSFGNKLSRMEIEPGKNGDTLEAIV
jgi:hypothetical protein